MTYRISSDNKVTIITKILALPEYEIKEIHTSVCKLDKTSVRVYD
ncbi:MAG: hypothetical protein ACK5Z5_01855 [Neisseriaceae bacterium]